MLVHGSLPRPPRRAASLACLVAALTLVSNIAPHAPEAAAQACAVRPVPRAELVRAMSLHGDYDILATTNRGRYTSELLLQLARWARERDPQGAPLYISPEDWFFSYIEVAGVSMLDAPRPASTAGKELRRETADLWNRCSDHVRGSGGPG